MASTGGHAELSGGPSGVGKFEQSLSAIVGSYTLAACVTGGDLAVTVGTSSGASDITSGTLTEGDNTTFSFSVTSAGTIYIGISNSNNDIREIDNIKLTLSSFSGFDHLNNATLKVRGDDFILDDAIVSSGTLTVTNGVSVVEGGLNYAPTVTMMPVEIAINNQFQVGEYKRLICCWLRLLDSRDIVIKNGNNTWKPFFNQFGDGVLDAPVKLFSGIKKVFLGGIERDNQITITQEQPLEFRLLAVNQEVSL